jgi:pimeloyl-ACP methyl ester carboxylesterase
MLPASRCERRSSRIVIRPILVVNSATAGARFIPAKTLCMGTIDRRTLLKGGIALAASLNVVSGVANAEPTAANASAGNRRLDPVAEAQNLAYDTMGNGETVFMVSGFPSTRRSWYRLIPLLARDYQCIPTDLPSFGGSRILDAPASTENVGRIFHEFVTGKLKPPVHVVAHDFGAWCAYSWQLLYPQDFKSLTLIEAGIPGITLPPTVELSDYKRKWNFIFQMLPDLPAELTRGKEALYVGWWYKNKVYKPGSIPASDIAAYVASYARPGRMDAAFDYCRNILVDIDFNKKNFAGKSAIKLLAVGGEYSIPQMGQSLAPYFENCAPLVVADSGHFVPEEQPAALAKALQAFLRATS